MSFWGGGGRILCARGDSREDGMPRHKPSANELGWRAEKLTAQREKKKKAGKKSYKPKTESFLSRTYK